MNNNPKTKIENIVVQDFENEVLIYDLTTNKAFCLNQTSAMVWNLCDGNHPVAEMSRILSKKLKEPITQDLIWLALDQFKRDNLLENEQFEINFSGLSRRQVIRKIGFASMVVLPVIASVVAPTSAMAQSSGLALLSVCSSPSQCASNNCVPDSFNGLSCCVAGISRGFDTVCATDQNHCNSRALQFCCSGSAGPVFPDSSCQSVFGFPLGCNCTR